MSILWCGGEEIDFPQASSISRSVTVGDFRADFARCAMFVYSDDYWYTSNTFTPFSSAWLSFRAVFTYSSGPGANNAVKLFGKSGTDAYIGFGTGSAESKLALYKFDGNTQTKLAEESGSSVSMETSLKFDIQIIDYGSTGTINLYMNGTLLVTYTGDIATNSQTTLDHMHIEVNNSATTCRFYISEVIVADEDTRLMALKTLVPDAAGDTNDWTNSYTDIDEAALSDADTIYTDTADDEFQCNLTGMPTGDYICKGVKVVARATDGVGGLGVAIGIKTNSTVDLGSDITLPGYWETIEEIYQQNPITTNRFTPAEIDALQFAVKAVTV